MNFFLNFLFFKFSEIKISTFEFISNSNNKYFNILKLPLELDFNIVYERFVFEYFEISRLLTILETNLFTTSVSNSVLTNSPFFRKIYSISCHDLIRRWFCCLLKKFVIKDIVFI